MDLNEVAVIIDSMSCCVQVSARWGLGFLPIGAVVLLHHEVLTITAGTAGRLSRPESKRGAADITMCNRQVTRVTAELEYCANRKQAGVSVSQIRGTVMRRGWPHTTWRWVIQEYSYKLVTHT